MAQGVTVKVSPLVMKWALEKMPVEKCAKDLRDKAFSWFSGTEEPTFRQLEDFSRKTSIPFGYFFLEQPPQEELPLLAFRTLRKPGGEPSRNLIEVAEQMESIQDWMHEYRDDQGWTGLKLVGCMKDNSVPSAIAMRMREDLEMKESWFRTTKGCRDSFSFMREKLGEKGVLVMMSGIVGSNTHRSLDINEFRAFTMNDPLAPLVFINASDSWSGRLFSLFHEAVHVWIGKNSLYNVGFFTCLEGNSSLEVLCNAVAGELLVPENLFVAYWSENSPLSDAFSRIDFLAEDIFHVGPMVVARKALDHGFITKAEYQEVEERQKQLFFDTKQRPQGGGDFYNTTCSRLDHYFALALDESVKEGKTTYTEAFQLTGTSLKTYEQVMAKVKEGVR